MILPNYQIAVLCQRGMVTPFHPEMINPASLDVRLGDSLLIESAESRELKPYPFHKHHELDPYLLQPGQFVLAPTMEAFNLPDTIAAQFMLKSSRAREGLEHLMAGYCDPGWSGSVLTMELDNSRQRLPIPLWPGMKIGQMVFHAIAARRVHGLPDEWEPRIYQVLGDHRQTIGYSLTGAVPAGVISRGPRKGRLKWPPKGQLREVIITSADLAAATAEWVAATGLCPKCGGEGRVAWLVSVAHGTEYRPCKECGGTGKASSPADETTTTNHTTP